MTTFFILISLPKHQIQFKIYVVLVSTSLIKKRNTNFNIFIISENIGTGKSSEGHPVRYFIVFYRVLISLYTVNVVPTYILSYYIYSARLNHDETNKYRWNDKQKERDTLRQQLKICIYILLHRRFQI